MRRTGEPAEDTGLLRALLHGAACLSLPMAVALLLRPVLADGSPVLFAVVILALVPGAYIALMVYPTRTWLAFAGIGLVTLSPWPFVFGLDYRLVGTIPATTVHEAGVGGIAAGFRLTDARPRPDLQIAASFDGMDYTRPLPRRSGPVEGPTRLLIMPVTEPGWAPTMPVRLVAVQSLTGPAPRGVPWPAPWADSGGLLTRLPDDRLDQRVRALLRAKGLVAAPNLVLGDWSADPVAAWRREAAFAVTIWAGCVAAWTVLLLFGWPRARAQGHWGIP